MTPEDALTLLDDLDRRSYRTYMSRLKASERLSSRHHAWNVALISASGASTIASVGLLTDDDLYGSAGETLLVCVAVLTLIASLVASSLDYSGRSRNMFVNYRRIQRLSAEVERAKADDALHNAVSVQALYARYDDLLDESENHTAADFAVAFPDIAQVPKLARAREHALSALPYVSLVIPLALLIPLLNLIARGF